MAEVTGSSSPMAELTGPSSPMAELTVVSTPMDDHSTDAITVPVEITELTSSDEIAQWVGVNLNSDEEEEELPEFNSVEDKVNGSVYRGLMCAPADGINARTIHQKPFAP
jgi:hypothetical protein